MGYSAGKVAVIQKKPPEMPRIDLVSKRNNSSVVLWLCLNKTEVIDNTYFHIFITEKLLSIRENSIRQQVNG